MRNKGVFLLGVVLLLTVMVVPLTAQTGDQAWVRVFHLAVDWTEVDVYWGADLVLNAVEPGTASDWAALSTEGDLISIAEIGTGMVNTVLEITDVALEADHRYTVAIIGQDADGSLGTLWIDETAAVADFDLSAGAAILMINNMAGSPPITFYDDDVAHSADVAYGEFVTTFVPAVSWDTAVAVETGSPDNVILDFDSEADGLGGFWEPYTVYLFGLIGTYPGEMWADYGLADAPHYTVAANALELLRAFTGKNLYYDANSGVTFDFTTFVSLVEEAGLTDLLTGDAPITVFAPTDYAFAQLPAGALDELRADPERLRVVLLNHVVDGDVPDLSGMAMLTTAGGTTYRLSYDEENFSYWLNDEISVSDFNYPVGNGTAWLVSDAVLLPE